MDVLTWSELLPVLQQASDTGNTYISNEPMWVRIWVLTMMVVLAPSVIFAIFKREARLIAWGLILTMIWTPFFIATAGPSKLWGITHLSFWTPGFIYGIAVLRAQGLTGWFNKWLLAATAVIGVSLAFDIYDVARFFSAG